MAIDFPSSPTLNQTYTYAGRTWKWNGEGWQLLTNAIGDLILTSDDGGAAVGPTATFYRNSATPAASDLIGGLIFDGEDSAGNTQTYAQIAGVIEDPTSTSEDGAIAFYATSASTLTERMRVTSTGATVTGDLAVDTNTLYVDAANNRVGVGTTAPGTNFQVGITGTGGLAIDASGSVIYGVFGTGGNAHVRAQAPSSSGGGDIYLGGSARGDADKNIVRFATNGLIRGSFVEDGTFHVGGRNVSATPTAGTIAGVGGSGTDIAGANLTIQGGRGTGTGAGGDIIFSTAAAGTTGSTLNAAVERARISSTGTTSLNSASGSSPLVVSVNSSQLASFDSSGRLLLNATASYSVGGAERRLQINGTGADNAALSVVRWENSDAPPRILFGKTRGSVGTFTAVQDGDFLGQIEWFGSNGTDLTNMGARIQAIVDGTPFSGGDTTDMPTSLVFSTTADGAGSPTERLRIGPAGVVTVTGQAVVNANASGTALTITQTGSGDCLLVEDVASDTTPFVIKSDGKVGVGTSAPNYVFDVAGAASFGRTTGGDSIFGNSTANWNFGQLQLTRHASNATPFKNLEFLLNGDTVGGTSFYSNVNFVTFTDSIPTTSSTSTALNAQLGVYAPNAIRFGTNSSDRAIINSSGQLLVGTTSTTLTSTIQAYSSSGTALIDAVGDGTFANLRANGYGQNPLVHFRRASGTLASPTFAGASTGLGLVQWWAYDGAAFQPVGEMFCNTTSGASGVGDLPTEIGWKVTPNASATMATQMLLSSEGYLTVGGSFSSQRQLTLNGATESNLIFWRSGGAADEKAWRVLTDTSKNLTITAMGDAVATNANAYIIGRGTGATVDYHAFWAGGSERLRIRSDGNIGQGNVGTANARLYMTGDITGSTDSFGIYQQSTIKSDVTNGAFIFRSNMATEAASFTLTSLYHFFAGQSPLGAGSAITNQYGLFISNTLTGAANNFGLYLNNITATSSGKTSYGIYSAIAAGSGGGTSYFIYNGGTAPSFLGSGNAGLGTATSPSKLLHLRNTGAGAQLLVEDSGSTGGLIQIGNASTGITATDGLLIGFDGSNNAIFENQENTAVVFYTNNTEVARLSSTGNFGIGAAVTTGHSLVVQGTSGSSTGTALINAWSGTAASPTETIDWPTPVLNLRGYDNFFQQSMLSFGYSNDSTYQTGSAVWVFRLYDTRGGTPAPTSSSTNTALYLTGPASLLLDPDENVKIGGTAKRATTEGTNQLVLFNGTAPAGTLANGVSFYSTTGEAYVMDAAGNATLLSPHDKETNEWIYDSVDTRNGKRLRIRMEAMMRFLNEHFGLDFVEDFIEEVPA